MDWNCQFHNLLASFWHILCLFSPILSHQWLKMQTIARTNFALVLFLTVREYLARSYKFENCSCCCDLCSNTSRKASNTHLLHQVLHGFPESLWKSLKVSKITESLESLWKSLKITESLESLWKSLKITESFWKSCTFHLTVKHSKRVLSLVFLHFWIFDRKKYQKSLIRVTECLQIRVDWILENLIFGTKMDY